MYGYGLKRTRHDPSDEASGSTIPPGYRGKGGQRRPPFQFKPRVAFKPKEVPPVIKPLSTSSSQELNDPLYLTENLVLGLNGLALRRQTLEFTVDCKGFVEIVEACYIELSAEMYFSKYITQGLFYYYCLIAYYVRIYRLCHLNGKDFDMLYDRLIVMVPDNLVLPKPISAYLNGLGNLIDPNARIWHIRFPILPTINIVHSEIKGGFGTMNAENHYKYLIMPSPCVAIFRIAHEIVSVAPSVDIGGVWDLPGDLDPPGVNVLRPTNNIIGWRRVIPVTQEQCLKLKDLGFRAVLQAEAGPDPIVDFVCDWIGGIPISQYILAFVSSKIVESKVMPYVPMEPGVLNGSLVQLGYIERGDIPPDPIDYVGDRRYGEGEITGLCYHQLSTIIGSGIDIFQFRVNLIDRVDAYGFCFGLPQAGQQPPAMEQRPDAWAKTLNNGFIYGDMNRWNISDFVLPVISGITAVQSFVKEMIKRYSKM